MDSKFRKADSYQEFYGHFRQYIDVLVKTHVGSAAYSIFVKDWAEYSAVNKRYIFGGPRDLKNMIRAQMMYLLKKDFQILNYFLDLFGKDKECNFSQIKEHFEINDEFKANAKAWSNVMDSNPKEDSVATIEDDETYKDLPDLIPIDDSDTVDSETTEPKTDKMETTEPETVESVSDSPKQEGTLEHVVTEALIDGAKLIGNLVGTVDKILEHEPSRLRVKLIGPRRLDLSDRLLGELGSATKHTISFSKTLPNTTFEFHLLNRDAADTECVSIDDYDIGIYAFDLDDWGNLDDIHLELPHEKPRIGCILDDDRVSCDEDYCMAPLLSDILKIENWTSREILDRLAVFA